MIRHHEFNSAWWGKPVGIIDEVEFFSLSASKQATLLAEFAWVEFRTTLESANFAELHRSGFVQVDTQVRFKLGLTRLPDLPSANGLQITFADNDRFTVPADQIADFAAERFSYLCGASARKIRQRYAMWGASLIDASPEHCIQVSSASGVQGWFLASQHGGSTALTLAMLHDGASTSGFLVYVAALRAFADRGARLGTAAFSVTNAPVHNIYAALNARFVSTEGCWFWVRE